MLFICTLYSMIYRTATKSQIIKAYRKLAREWHPDKFEGEDKEMAQKKFIDIAAAKEVLTDPGETRCCSHHVRLHCTDV